MRVASCHKHRSIASSLRLCPSPALRRMAMVTWSRSSCLQPRRDHCGGASCFTSLGAQSNEGFIIERAAQAQIGYNVPSAPAVCRAPRVTLSSQPLSILSSIPAPMPPVFGSAPLQYALMVLLWRQYICTAMLRTVPLLKWRGRLGSPIARNSHWWAIRWYV